MSSRRLCVRISNCSRLFLSTCGERFTVNFSIFVGSGIGPRTCAPVRFAVFTISRVDASRMRWSNALSRMRMFLPFMLNSEDKGRTADDGSAAYLFAHSCPIPPFCPLSCVLCRPLFDNLCDDASADRAAALADRKPKLLLHRYRNDQLHCHRHVVPGHHHLGPLGKLHHPRHVGRAEVEL